MVVKMIAFVDENVIKIFIAVILAWKQDDFFSDAEPHRTFVTLEMRKVTRIFFFIDDVNLFETGAVSSLLCCGQQQKFPHYKIV